MVWKHVACLGSSRLVNKAHEGESVEIGQVDTERAWNGIHRGVDFFLRFLLESDKISLI